MKSKYRVVILLKMINNESHPLNVDMELMDKPNLEVVLNEVFSRKYIPVSPTQAILTNYIMDIRLIDYVELDGEN